MGHDVTKWYNELQAWSVSNLQFLKAQFEFLQETQQNAVESKVNFVEKGVIFFCSKQRHPDLGSARRLAGP